MLSTNASYLDGDCRRTKINGLVLKLTHIIYSHATLYVPFARLLGMLHPMQLRNGRLVNIFGDVQTLYQLFAVRCLNAYAWNVENLFHNILRLIYNASRDNQKFLGAL